MVVAVVVVVVRPGGPPVVVRPGVPPT